MKHYWIDKIDELEHEVAVRDRVLLSRIIYSQGESEKCVKCRLDDPIKPDCTKCEWVKEKARKDIDQARIELEKEKS